ncbi:rod-binding protein [Paragemmobacter straminiformis]|uniref:Rod-binding protein n=1 Tax=Paragemmobacter straminiformis TaxID=2045119 RepID=A0A842I5V2_9RHOB|nr:rod-binding protein [Gemmobacter straminiformis]MBC2834757.1 rod-binding protein [Gemmobacter straminiformis]
MDVKAAPALSLKPEPDKPAMLRQAAEGFEELFLTQLLKAARAGHLGEDIMGSSAVDSTRDMFDAQIAKSSSGRTGFGIADAVERQFQRFTKG